MLEEKIRWFYENEKFFHNEYKSFILETIKNCSQAEFDQVKNLKLKNPSKSFRYALGYGYLGIDRFYLNSVAIGILKMLTFGGFFALWIIDATTAKKRTYLYNTEKVLSITSPQNVDRVIAENKKSIAQTVQNTSDTTREVIDFFDDISNSHNNRI